MANSSDAFGMLALIAPVAAIGVAILAYNNIVQAKPPPSQKPPPPATEPEVRPPKYDAIEVTKVNSVIQVSLLKDERPRWMTAANYDTIFDDKYAETYWIKDIGWPMIHLIRIAVNDMLAKGANYIFVIL